jgi:hypothetical protein
LGLVLVWELERVLVQELAWVLQQLDQRLDFE